MSRVVNNNKTAMVHIEEIDNKGGVRFKINYCVNGERVRESLREIPLVKKGTRQYKEARLLADRIAAQRMEELREGTYGGKMAKSAILLKDWISQCAKNADNRATVGGSRNTWARMLRHTIILSQAYKKDTKLVEIDKTYVRGFINFLQKEYSPGRGKDHYSAKTADKYYGCLRFVLNEAKREEIISVNPCELISSNDKIKVPESNRSYLTIEELKKIISASTKSAETKRVFLFMCFTGLRISDVKQLMWEHFECDGEEWQMLKVTQKTKKAAYLPVSKIARTYLPEKEETGMVFKNLPCEATMNRALKIMAKHAGIKKVVTLHTARHTFATMLLTEGADIYTVSELLTHSNLNTTRIYGKIVGSKKRAAVELLNDAL